MAFTTALMKTSFRKHCVYFLIAESFAFCFGYTYLAHFEDVRARYFFHWRTWDGLVIWFTLALFGAAVLLVWRLASRLEQRYTNYFLHGFNAFSGFILARNVLTTLIYFGVAVNSRIYSLGLLAGALFFFLGSLFCFRVVTSGFRHFYLILAPLPLVVLFNVLKYPSTFHYSPPPLTFSGVSKPVRTTGRNAYVFVFDEWSYKRSFDDGRLIPAFVRLKQFCREAVVFHRAYTPQTMTLSALPDYLFGVGCETEMRKGQVGFKGPNGWLDAADMDSIFRKWKDRGVYTAFVGYHLPYSVWLGTDVDYCFTRAAPWKKPPPGKDYEGPLFYFLQCLNAARFKERDFFTLIFSRRNQKILYSDVHALTRAIITQPGKDTFGFFHYPIPHFPYVYTADNVGSIFDVRGRYDVEAYVKQFGFLDRTIGQIIDTLKSCGKYDSSLIIFTTDHGFRCEKVHREDPRHICFFMKLPHQKARRDVSLPIEVYKLGRIVDRCLDEGPPPTLEKILPLIRKSRAP